tara:strand:+ start:136 stop:336 length:201 start_codon:yes stop_codon:yes gene_type:complete
MNEEVNAILQVYQNKINNLLAQTIALEAKVITANNTIAKLQEEIKGLDKPTSVPQDPDPVVDGGEG